MGEKAGGEAHAEPPVTSTLRPLREYGMSMHVSPIYRRCVLLWEGEDCERIQCTDVSFVSGGRGELIGAFEAG